MAVNRQIQAHTDELTSIKNQLKEYGVEEASQSPIINPRLSENGTPMAITPVGTNTTISKEEYSLQRSIQEHPMDIDTQNPISGLHSSI